MRWSTEVILPHRQVLLTEGLIEQRKLSLGTSEAQVDGLPQLRLRFTSKLGLENCFRQWHDEMTIDVLFES